MNFLPHQQMYSPSKGHIGLVIILLLMTGCAAKKHVTVQEAPRGDPYSREDLDELLDFGTKLAQKTPAERADVCRELLKRPVETGGTALELHRMIGGLLSDDCGDFKEIQEKIEKIPLSSLKDERVRRLVAMQSETLKRMAALTDRLDILKRKQKSLKSLLGKVSKPSAVNSQQKISPVTSQTKESAKQSTSTREAKAQPKKSSKPESATPAQSGDDRLLRDKLEAIRDMERKLDAAGDGN